MGDRDDTGTDARSLERDLRDSLLVRAAGAPPDRLARGTTVAGRYQVLHLIGRGGMGAVYRAYDPELNRLVALKLLPAHAPGRDRADLEQRRTRMLREAQALAQVAHPNVVSVYDVGRHEETVFIAMELVAGQTLDAWLRAERPSPRARIDVLLSAGAGLSAAHCRGIAHLDFKPSNTILGEDGRVRIIDFGLARPAGPEAGASDGDGDRAGPDPPLYARLTRTGDSYGTPGYMAPEQYRGAPAGAKSDQFAFCVVLYEALAEKPPFSRAQVATGSDVSRLPADPSIPAWVHRILARGLALDPDDRFEDMEALLAALRRDPAKRRRRLLAGIGALLAALVVVVGGWYTATRAERMCRTAGSPLASVWDDQVEGSVRSAFARTGRPHAGDTAARVARALDAYTDAWVQQRVEACEATHVHGTQSGQMLDRRIHCLDRRLSQAGALLRLFVEQADGEMVDQAVEAVSNLPRLSACADVALLQAAVPQPEDPRVRSAVESVRKELDEVASLRHVGKPQAALGVARPLVERARDISYPAVQAEAVYLFGAAQKDANQYQEAGETLFEAMNLADQVPDDALRVRAAIDLAASFIDNGEQDEAERWLAVAGAAVQRLRGDDELESVLCKTRADLAQTAGRYADAEPLYRCAIDEARAAHGSESPEVAGALNSLALLYYHQGEYDRAERALGESLQVWQAAIGPDNPGIANSLNNLAWLYKEQGRLGEAEGLFLRALRIYEQSLGAKSFSVGTALNNLASVYKNEKRYAEAEKTYERSIQVYTEAAGPEHPEIATPLGNLANLLSKLGRYDEAESLTKRALKMRERAFGADHPAVANTLTNLGALFIKQERYAAAEPVLERALDIRERKLGGEHDHVATTLYYLAVVHRERGSAGTAERLFERSLQIREKRLGSEHPDVAISLTGLGALYYESKKNERAIECLERARAICEAGTCGSMTVSRLRFALARALWDRGADKGRALELARQARDGWAGLPDTTRRARLLAEADAWLRARARHR